MARFIARPTRPTVKAIVGPLVRPVVPPLIKPHRDLSSAFSSLSGSRKVHFARPAGPPGARGFCGT